MPSHATAPTHGKPAPIEASRARPAGVPSIDIDVYSEESLRDPMPVYELLRDAGPVVWLERHNAYAVARYEEVVAVLTHPEIFCSGAGVGLTNFKTETSWRTPSIILEADAPQHTQKRRILTRILSPLALRGLRQEFERQAAAFVDRMIDMGSCDGVKDLAEAYPLKVFGDAVGIVRQGRAHLLPYGDLVFNAFGPINERFRERMDAATETLDWIAFACRRENLTAEGFGAKLYAAADAGELTHDEANLLVRTFLSAGLDTTVFTLSNAIVALAMNPLQWELVRQDPDLARNALEEVMRYESTFQSYYRTTAQATELAGIAIGPNQKIWIGIASANRDPRQWAEPEKFDVQRRVSGSLAFGTGIHGCVGQMIARMEGEIVLKTLARKVKKLVPTGSPVIHFNNTVRGYAEMPLTVVPNVN